MGGNTSHGGGRRLAILGAGPAGLYAARAAAASKRFAGIDVIEALPAPYGLVRYGVAPDHPETKRVTKVFDHAFDSAQVRFLGNVTVGRDIAHTELMRYYDALIYATGIPGGRRLPVPGADLPGSLSSAEFVSWYSGHPDARPCPPLAAVESAVVIGGGNVALDVARLLITPPHALRATDVPDDVLDQFHTGHIREVHVLVRKGPAQTRYSPVVLREFADLTDGTLHVDPRQITAAAAEAAPSRAAADNLEIFQTWTNTEDEREDKSGRPPLQFHFWTTPTQITGGNGAEAVEVTIDTPGIAPEKLSIAADLVVHCVGFHAPAPDWLPSTTTPGVVDNLHGRVHAHDGTPLVGVYVSGWLKRGPSGTIATNRIDAEETVTCLVDDLDSLPRRSARSSGVETGDVLDLLLAAGVPVVSWTGWRAIEAAEHAAGTNRGAISVKLNDRRRLISIGHHAAVAE